MIGPEQPQRRAPAGIASGQAEKRTRRGEPRQIRGRLSSSRATAGPRRGGRGFAQPRRAQFFDWERKTCERIPVNEQVGVAPLLADVALSPEDERALHLHFVAGRRNGTALAGQRKQVRQKQV
jgi:hypothetical protein